MWSRLDSFFVPLGQGNERIRRDSPYHRLPATKEQNEFPVCGRDHMPPFLFSSLSLSNRNFSPPRYRPTRPSANMNIPLLNGSKGRLFPTHHLSFSLSESPSPSRESQTRGFTQPRRLPRFSPPTMRKDPPSSPNSIIPFFSLSLRRLRVFLLLADGESRLLRREVSVPRDFSFFGAGRSFPFLLSFLFRWREGVKSFLVELFLFLLFLRVIFFFRK